MVALSIHMKELYSDIGWTLDTQQPLMYGCIYIWFRLKAMWLRRLNMVAPL
jgi:hypothetical protein